MAVTVRDEDRDGHLLCLEHVRGRMAKADLQKLETDAKAAYGKTLQRAIQLAGLGKGEAANALGVDAAQLGRWFAGTETAQTWRFAAHAKLRESLRLAEAEEAERRGEVEIEHVIKIRRRG